MKTSILMTLALTVLAQTAMANPTCKFLIDPLLPSPYIGEGLNYFNISGHEQLYRAHREVDRKFINETIFVIPHNDGEAAWAHEILKAVHAPLVFKSNQPWGAKLENDIDAIMNLASGLNNPKARRAKNIVVFEMPGTASEAQLRALGKNVIIIDHHKYDGLDRSNPISSLEQLMTLIRWPVSKLDHAIAVNDRSFVPGLKEMGLTNDEIRMIRRFDQIAQGKNPVDVEANIIGAQKIAGSLPKRNGVYILDYRDGKLDIDSNAISVELSILHNRANIFEITSNKIGFSGDAALATQLFNIDYTTYGYAKENIIKYTAGNNSLFGFKPKAPAAGSTERISASTLDAVQKILFGDK